MYRYESPRLLAAQALLTGVLSPKVFDRIQASVSSRIANITLPYYFDLIYGQNIVPYILNNSLRERTIESSSYFTPQILAQKYWGIKISPPMSDDFDFEGAASDFIRALQFPFSTYLKTPRPLNEARNDIFEISVVDHLLKPADLQFYLSSLRKPH